ncbi:MAG: trigger factor [Clostridiales bacterium]|nr:trigger factor [Clostridiales bacterium]
MKKQIIAATLIIGMAVSLIGCGKSTGGTTDSASSNTSGKDKIASAAKVVTLGDYKGLSMEIPEVTEEDIQEYINTNLLSPKATYEQIKDGKVKDGDLVNINYTGKIDGVAFDGGTDDSEAGTNLSIGSGQFIEGFESGLVGVAVGDTVDLNLKFPEDYGKDELNGKDVVFTVTVNYICGDQITPELTDAFVTDNTDYKTVDDYKAYVKETLETSNKTQAENTIWSEAVKNATISEYPQEDIDAALSSMLNYYTSMASYYGTDLDTLLSYYGTSQDTFNDDNLETAKTMVAEKLVALAIDDAEKIDVTDDVYQNKVAEYATTYGYADADALKAAVSEDDIYQQIYMELGKQVVFDNAVTK